MTEQLTPLAAYFATRKQLDASLADGKLSREQHRTAVLVAQEPCRRELVAAEIVRKSGRPKNQAAGMAAGMTDEALARIGQAIASQGDVVAAIDAELNAIADAQPKLVAPLVVGPPMAGAPRRADDAPVGPPRTE